MYIDGELTREPTSTATEDKAGVLLDSSFAIVADGAIVAGRDVAGVMILEDDDAKV